MLEIHFLDILSEKVYIMGLFYGSDELGRPNALFKG